MEGLEEMYRILKPNGKLIVVTPLNFNKKEHWKIYYPPIQLSNILKKIGFKTLDWKYDSLEMFGFCAHEKRKPLMF